MKGAEEAGEAVTGEKLVAFAKEAGYDIDLEEMQNFFKDLINQNKGELSDVELDMVAGGKGALKSNAIELSIITLGLGCAAVSILVASFGNNCNDSFYE